MLERDLNKPETDPQELTFLDFERILKTKITFITSMQYKEMTGGLQEDIASFNDVPISSSLKDINNMEIWVNRSKFARIGAKKELLMQTTITHEVVEAWEILILKLSDKNYVAEGRSQAHNLALLHEFNFAYNHNCHDEYLSLIKRWSQNMGGNQRKKFRQENFDAYHEVVEKKWRPRPSYYTTPIKKLISEKLLVAKKPYTTFPDRKNDWIK